MSHFVPIFFFLTEEGNFSNNIRPTNKVLYIPHRSNNLPRLLTFSLFLEQRHDRSYGFHYKLHYE